MKIPVASAFAAILLLPLAAHAQSDRTFSSVGRTSSQAMPGDYFDIPQAAQLRVPLAPPAGPRHDSPPTTVSLVPSPGLARAIKAADAAEAACAADGFKVTVAVTDSAGNLKVALAPDGVRPNGVYMAMHKAVTVVGFKMSTLQLRAELEKTPSLMSQIKPNMSLLPGGLPIILDGAFVGAIATSGAAAHEEEKCANAGLSAIKSER